MDLEQTYSHTHAAFHCYELYLWCGCYGLLLITTFFLLRSRRAHKDAQQLQAAYTALHQEIQEQRAALNQATKREVLFQQAAETLPDAVIITEPTGGIQYSNAAAQQQTGYQEDELLAQSISLLLPESITEQQQSDSVIRVIKKDGTDYPASATAVPLHDQGGEILGTLFVLKNQSIHQQREQAQAAEQKRLLARLSKARRLETIGMMTGEVAHDLNNILSGILHHPEQLLRNLPGNSPLRPSLVSIRQSGQQAVALVADLLSAARAGSAVKEMNDLNKVVQEILAKKTLQDLFTEQAGISLHTRLCADPLPVNCSPSHIQQCLYNLLLNSCEAIHAGGTVGTITVSLDSRYLAGPPSALSSDAAGEYAVLSVADTGPSLSAVDRNRIFEPFYSKKILQRKGTGIGLAVLHNIMEEHKGWVDLPEQKTDQGNRFDLYLPLRPGRTLPLLQDSQRILIIEKEEEQQARLINLITELGYRALSVADSTGALSFLNRNRVDLIILNMAEEQGMAGETLHEQILFLHPSQKAVLLLAGSDEPLQAENVAFLQPGFNKQELQKACQKLLSSF